MAGSEDRGKPYLVLIGGQAHKHTLQVLNVQHPPVLRPGIQSPTTIVLMTCKDCHRPATVTLSGKWDLEQLR